MFKRRISEKERIDLLEYLAFQTKSGMSFKAALQRYLESDRSRRVIEAVEAVIEDISRGVKPSEALRDAEIISGVDYTLVTNSQHTPSALGVVVGLNKSKNKSADVMKRSIRTGLLVLGGILMLIPLFREDIEQLYMMFASMASMANNGKADPQIPFLVKYWWSAFVVVGVGALLYASASRLIRHIYQFHGQIYYRVFGYAVYGDLVSILTSLRQMGTSMSWAQSYAALAESSPNSYWGELFADVATNLKQGGKASSVIALRRGVIPVEVVHCFVDGEDTGEVETYLQKAIELCQERYDRAQEQIRTAVPIFFDLLTYFLIGYVAVEFVQDMNELGIMQVLTQIH